MAFWTSKNVGAGLWFAAPKTWRSGTGKRGIIHCVSHGNVAAQPETRGWHDKVVDALIENGSPMVSTNMGGSTAWGNDTAIAALTSAVGTAAGGGVKTDKVVLFGTSMGTLTALNWAKANPTLVAAIVCLLPVVNLADVHDNNRNGHAASIESAYGGAAGYASAVAAHNPSTSPASFTNIPIKLWYATNDPVIPTSVVTSFATATGAQTQSLGAVGHDPSSTPPQSVVDFIAPYV